MRAGQTLGRGIVVLVPGLGVSYSAHGAFEESDLSPVPPAGEREKWEQVTQSREDSKRGRSFVGVPCSTWHCEQWCQL